MSARNDTGVPDAEYVFEKLTLTRDNDIFIVIDIISFL